jgi:hypothetical protein
VYGDVDAKAGSVRFPAVQPFQRILLPKEERTLCYDAK